MRKASVRRTTNETDIRVKLNLDGRGHARVQTGIRFFDHMLELVARHAAFDLELTARGDLDVDQHHTVEDVGLVLGEAVLGKPISVLDLSVRARKALQFLGIQTIGDLATRTEAELMGVKNFGQTSLTEIDEKLSEFQLGLRNLD